jgi:hypothetical protein
MTSSRGRKRRKSSRNWAHRVERKQACGREGEEEEKMIKSSKENQERGKRGKNVKE